MRQIGRSLLMMILGLLALGATAEAARVSIDMNPNRAGIQRNIAVKVGDTVTVDVVVDNVTNLNAFEFDLIYAAKKLNATEITSGNFLPGTASTLNEDLGSPLMRSARKPIFLSKGARGKRGIRKQLRKISGKMLHYDEFILSDMGSSGTGVVLASITFTAVKMGQTQLRLPDVKLAAPYGVVILNGGGIGGKVRVTSKSR